jgi:uncharacterized SAM-binding protein YcdF (DUF218 family)
MTKTFLTCLIGLVSLLAIGLLGYLAVGALLSCPSGLPRSADVVVVLGGGEGARYARGRELVLAGYSKRLLLFNPSADERKDALERLQGVEIRIDDLPMNSWQEAIAVRAWMGAYGWRSVLVVSDPPHMLRVRYTWFSIFRGTELAYYLTATDPGWWSAWFWWRNPQSEMFVSDELLKLGYYIVQYRFDL